VVIDAAKRHHRRTGALGTKTGKSLRVAALLKGSEGQHFCRRHHPLTTAPMDTDLQHRHLLFLF
jgi:hypothetical protein